MIECCEPQCQEKSRPTRCDCPSCGTGCAAVAIKTILHHLKQPWVHTFSEEKYYFCSTPGCDVVYFSEDGDVISKSGIRTSIGIKEKTDDALICFCFGVSKLETESIINIKRFVIEQTKKSMCSCETANPSGKCCLKDF